jgi:plastocyanin
MSVRRQLVAIGAVAALAAYGLVLAVPGVAGAAAPANHPVAPKFAPAAPPPVVIGVDNTPPAGKNWEYTHYFPESNVNVPQGSVVLFQWDQGQLNGLHSVTFIPNGQTEAQVRQAFPTITKDTDNGENDTIIPPQTNNPTDATCSSSPQSPPCNFDGSSVLSSGIIPTGIGAAFAVQIAPNTSPGTYHYICLIHPGMSGSINVVAAGQPATSAGALATQAAAELNQLNAGAAAAEANASIPSFTHNLDGTKTWTEHVGVTADDVDLLEFLPNDLAITKGDWVKFDASATTQEVHTVSTPAAGNEGLAPFLPTQCEVAGGPDTPANENVNGPPQTGCADPSGYEQPLNLGVQGEPTNIVNLGTAASAFVSGRADTQALGAATAHSYRLANNGTYAFFCFFHQNMGAIIATPGYRLVGSDGSVYTHGGLDALGGNPPIHSPVVAFPTTADQQGYWLVTADGHTYNFGDAQPVGNVNGKVTAPIVGAAPSGGPNNGLWLVGKDGNVYALGSAKSMGSMLGTHLAAPVVGMVSDAGGGGYTIAAADGGVFTFGTAGLGGGQPRYYGSMGGKHLNKPIVAIGGLLDGTGYVLVASDGGVFTFGGAAFFGSLGATHLNAPIVGVSMTADFQAINNRAPGYRLVASDGGVFTFNASFLGSQGGSHVPAPIVGIGGNSG